MAEVHKKLLSSLCRVCGGNIVLKKGYKNAKTVQDYGSIIHSVYNVDVGNESENVHPKFLCGNCKRKLDRFLKFRGQDVPQLTAAVFEAHHSEKCTVCIPHSVRSSAKVDTNLHLKRLDDLMLEKGFTLFNIGDVNVKRTYLKPVLEHGQVVNSITLYIDLENIWKCLYYGKDVTEAAALACAFPNTLNDSNIKDFTEKLSDITFCDGIKDFNDVIDSKLDLKQPFLSENGVPVANVENSQHCPLKKENFGTIRHVSCSYAIIGEKNNICKQCAYYKNFLRSCRSRLNSIEPVQKKQRLSDSSKVNYRYLSRGELEERLAETQKVKKEAARKVVRMSNIISELLVKDGINIDTEQHENFKNIIETNECNFDVDSPQWLLWQQQKEQLSKRDSRGMRWHPLIIRWCLSIHYTSAAAYKQLTSNKLNFLKLPHVDTLRKYAQFTTPSSGFNPEILKRLVEEAKVDKLEDFQKNVTLCFDEMKIESDLVFRKSTGKLVGFTEMGDINEEFRVFESDIEKALIKDSKDSNEESFCQRELATHVIVYLVRGIFTKLCYPFGYFASVGFTSAQLYPCTIEATRVLHGLGFCVRVFVADGASPNRKFFKLMLQNEEDLHWTINPYDNTKKIYFMSDPPHLLKTTRNCFENSNWNKKTRNLHLDGQDVSWKHVIDVYEWDLGLNRCAPGLRKLHKFTEEHVKLTPRLRMKVNLAAQVLSRTTANALEIQALHMTTSTQGFVKIIDRVFDCLNVSKINKGRFGKPELEVYSSGDDWRFKFLEEEFLHNYLDRWTYQVNGFAGMTQDEKNRCLLSKQTIRGWKMTVKSFVAVAKELLGLDGVRFLLSEKFSQDPIEEHFARQRRRGGCNENPNLFQFQNQELTLNVMQSELITDLKGNSCGRDQDQVQIDIHDMRRLPTKKSK